MITLGPAQLATAILNSNLDLRYITCEFLLHHCSLFKQAYPLLLSQEGLTIEIDKKSEPPFTDGSDSMLNVAGKSAIPC